MAGIQGKKERVNKTSTLSNVNVEALKMYLVYHGIPLPKNLIRSNPILVLEAQFGTRFVQLVVVDPARRIY